MKVNKSIATSEHGMPVYNLDVTKLATIGPMGEVLISMPCLEVDLSHLRFFHEDLLSVLCDKGLGGNDAVMERMTEAVIVELQRASAIQWLMDNID